jgi:hypothetical protein
MISGELVMTRSEPVRCGKWRSGASTPGRCANMMRRAASRRQRGYPPERFANVNGAEMDRRVAVALYLVAMIAIIIGVDFMFFRNRIWERLAVNIGIVLVFAAFYFRFFKP